MNYTPYGYQPYQTAAYQSPYYTPTQGTPTAPQPTMNTNKLYANGIEDVRFRQLPTNSDYIFLDNDKPLLYRKTTDATGKTDIQVFTIAPYQDTKPAEPVQVDFSQYVLRSDFELLRAELAELRETVAPSAQKTPVKKNSGV